MYLAYRDIKEGNFHLRASKPEDCSGVPELNSALITVANTQPANVQQPHEIRALINDLQSTFEDFEMCNLRLSETGASAGERPNRLRSFNMEIISNYMQAMNEFELCNKDARNFLSGAIQVSQVQFELQRSKANLRRISISGQNCADITDNIGTSIDTLVSALQREANFEGLRDCSIRIDPDHDRETDHSGLADYIVNANGLYLRRAPRSDSESICLIPLNSLLFDNRNRLGAWYEVIYRPVRPDLDRCPNSGQAMTGWVHSEFLLPIR